MQPINHDDSSSSGLLNKATILTILGTVTDPEIPVLTILDLGILRDVRLNGEEVEVVITPTYTGCPAMDMIQADIITTLKENGYQNVKVTTILEPAWTTDWLTEDGKQKLLSYGIAPPSGTSDKNALIGKSRSIACPQCSSVNTTMISAFGSTACKALYRCNDCLEPFDYFKCH